MAILFPLPPYLFLSFPIRLTICGLLMGRNCRLGISLKCVVAFKRVLMALLRRFRHSSRLPCGAFSVPIYGRVGDSRGASLALCAGSACVLP